MWEGAKSGDGDGGGGGGYGGGGGTVPPIAAFLRRRLFLARDPLNRVGPRPSTERGLCRAALASITEARRCGSGVNGGGGTGVQGGR